MDMDVEGDDNIASVLNGIASRLASEQSASARQACNAVASLAACNAEARAELRARGTIPRVVRLLEGSEEEVTDACYALAALCAADRACQDDAYAAGALEHLVAIARRSACGTLDLALPACAGLQCLCAANVPNQNVVRGLGVVGALVQLMRPGQPSATRLRALSALTSAVAQNAAGQDAARAAGALGVVAAMLSAGGVGTDPVATDLPRLRYVLSATHHLVAAHAPSADAFRTAGGLGWVVSAMRVESELGDADGASEQLLTRRLAADLMHALVSASAACLEGALSAGAVAALVQLLRTPLGSADDSEKLLVAACGALATLAAADARCRAELVAMHGMATLVVALQAGPRPLHAALRSGSLHVEAAVLRAVTATVAADSGAQEALRKVGGLVALTKLLGERADELRTLARALTMKGSEHPARRQAAGVKQAAGGGESRRAAADREGHAGALAASLVAAALRALTAAASGDSPHNRELIVDSGAARLAAVLLREFAPAQLGDDEGAAAEPSAASTASAAGRARVLSACVDVCRAAVAFLHQCVSGCVRCHHDVCSEDGVPSLLRLCDADDAATAALPPTAADAVSSLLHLVSPHREGGATLACRESARAAGAPRRLLALLTAASGLIESGRGAKSGPVTDVREVMAAFGVGQHAVWALAHVLADDERAQREALSHGAARILAFLMGAGSTALQLAVCAALSAFASRAPVPSDDGTLRLDSLRTACQDAMRSEGIVEGAPAASA